MFERLAAVTAVLVLLASVLALGACSGAGKDDPARAALQSISGEWVLSEINGAPLRDTLPDNFRAPTLSIDAEGNVSGFAGINRMRGSLDPAALARGEFRVPSMASTKMAGPPEAMSVESRYLQAITDAEAYSLEEGTLVLRRGDQPLLRFVRGS